MKQTLFLPFLLLFLACTPADKQPAAPVVAATDSVPAPVAIAHTDSMHFTIDYLTGHFDPATHPDFTLVAEEYADRAGLYLRKDTYAAFLRMYQAAQKDGVTLVIRSATRNFDNQKGIWEAKWRGERKLEGNESAPTAYPVPKDRALAILRYSSMPGSSRHHWGTDMDLNNFTNEYFETGQGKKIYDWLRTHAATYGFCQPYTAKGPDRPNGYYEERWHWSYLPIASQLTRLARTELKNEMITGFLGAETADDIHIVENYVLGISEECLKE